MKHIIFNKPIIKQTHKKEIKNTDFDHLEALKRIDNKEPMDENMKNIMLINPRIRSNINLMIINTSHLMN